ncbi:hypothetical protein C8R44DRAFT_798263 [Mycena epipterygia]|nr:hypothetical protein C8R44DRAFT_798263 [Mycena epipterygia]
MTGPRTCVPLSSPTHAPLLALPQMDGRDQLAQELIDRIISLLHDSSSDWLACALVSRSWVYTA